MRNRGFGHFNWLIWNKGGDPWKISWVTLARRLDFSCGRDDHSRVFKYYFKFFFS